MVMIRWSENEVRPVRLEEFDERYGRYRLNGPQQEREMAASLRRYGQLSPVVVCLREERPVLVDGFKRLRAARGLRGLSTLSARTIEADDSAAKAALYALNRVGRHPQELEEAWIVHALVREDGLSQVEVAQLLGHHKSWVSRRLALLEKLCEEARADLQLGLLTPTMARQLVRLPVGNQSEALAAARRESLTAAEVKDVVDLLLGSVTREKEEFVLAKPRQALAQWRSDVVRNWDPRLSSAGNRVNRRLASLLEELGRMQAWLAHRGRGELALCDRRLLAAGFSRLAEESQQVAGLSATFVKDIGVRDGEGSAPSEPSAPAVRILNSDTCARRPAEGG